MGPRSHERGNVRRDSHCGAHRAASMGPRSHERGNAVRQAANSAKARGLQWGRVLMNAETPASTRLAVGHLGLRASMGPRSHERGNRSISPDLPAASMPRSHERGNPTRLAVGHLGLRASMGPRSHETRKPSVVFVSRCPLSRFWARSHERGNRPLDNSLRNKGFFACYREVVVCTRSHWLVGRVVMA